MIIFVLMVVMSMLGYAIWVIHRDTLICDRCGRRFVGFDLIEDDGELVCPVCYLNKK